jgi:hypothetical protein
MPPHTCEHHGVGAGVEGGGGDVILEDDVHASRQAALRGAGWRVCMRASVSARGGSRDARRWRGAAAAAAAAPGAACGCGDPPLGLERRATASRAPGAGAARGRGRTVGSCGGGWRFGSSQCGRRSRKDGLYLTSVPRKPWDPSTVWRPCPARPHTTKCSNRGSGGGAAAPAGAAAGARPAAAAAAAPVGPARSSPAPWLISDIYALAPTGDALTHEPLRACLTLRCLFWARGLFP